MTPKIHMRYRNVFACGGDLHRETAAEIFKVDPKDVTEDQRGVAKNRNYVYLYGVNARGDIAHPLVTDKLSEVTCEECKAYFSKDAIVERLEDRLRRVPKPARGY